MIYSPFYLKNASFHAVSIPVDQGWKIGNISLAPSEGLQDPCTANLW